MTYVSPIKESSMSDAHTEWKEQFVMTFMEKVDLHTVAKYLAEHSTEWRQISALTAATDKALEMLTTPIVKDTVETELSNMDAPVTDSVVLPDPSVQQMFDSLLGVVNSEIETRSLQVGRLQSELTAIKKQLAKPATITGKAKQMWLNLRVKLNSWLKRKEAYLEIKEDQQRLAELRANTKPTFHF